MKRIPLRADRDDASSVIGYVELKDVHEQTLAEHMATFGRMGVTGRVTVNGMTKGVDHLCIAPTKSVPLWNNQIRVDVPERTPEIGNRDKASVDGKPQPGQWWFQTDKQDRSDAKYFRFFFCGHTPEGDLVFQDNEGACETSPGFDWSGWHHEPACTGWDWVPEVKKTVSPDVVNDLAVSVRKETKADVVESPDDWVTQDRVRVRAGVDWFRYPTIDYLKEWRLAEHRDNWEPQTVHGWSNENGHKIEVRCRRRDLPVVEETLAVDQSKLGRPEVFKSPGEGYRFVNSDEVVLETDDRAYLYEDSESAGLIWGEVKKAVWFEASKTAGGLRRKLRARNVVFRRKAVNAATVTVYEVVYGDTVEKLDHDTLVGDECLNRYKRRFKYVSVVSTKTVEVML